MAAKVWPGYSGTPSGQWEQIEPPIEVAGSPATTVDFVTTLSTRWDRYRIEVVAPAASGTVTLSLRVNAGAGTGHTQILTSVNGTTVSAAESATAVIGALGAFAGSLICEIMGNVAPFKFQSHNLFFTGSAAGSTRFEYGHVTNSGALTGLGVTDGAGAIPVGTVMSLFGRVA